MLMIFKLKRWLKNNFNFTNKTLSVTPQSHHKLELGATEVGVKVKFLFTKLRKLLNGNRETKHSF